MRREFVKEKFVKYRSVICYIGLSALTATLETAIGYLMVSFFSCNVVVANSTGIVIGATLHFLLTSKAVFHVKYSWRNVLIYVGTFLLGMLLQNTLIWICYERLFRKCLEVLRYLISKAVSLILPFGIMYFVRGSLYNWSERKQQRLKKG